MINFRKRIFICKLVSFITLIAFIIMGMPIVNPNSNSANAELATIASTLLLGATVGALKEATLYTFACLGGHVEGGIDSNELCYRVLTGAINGAINPLGYILTHIFPGDIAPAIELLRDFCIEVGIELRPELEELNEILTVIKQYIYDQVVAATGPNCLLGTACVSSIPFYFLSWKKCLDNFSKSDLVQIYIKPWIENIVQFFQDQGVPLEGEPIYEQFGVVSISEFLPIKETSDGEIITLNIGYQDNLILYEDAELLTDHPLYESVDKICYEAIAISPNGEQSTRLIDCSLVSNGIYAKPIRYYVPGNYLLSWASLPWNQPATVGLKLKVTAYDSNDWILGTDETDRVDISVVDSPPCFSNAAVLPENPTEDQPVVFSVQYNDIDGNPVDEGSVKVLVDGVEVSMDSDSNESGAVFSSDPQLFGVGDHSFSFVGQQGGQAFSDECSAMVSGLFSVRPSESKNFDVSFIRYEIDNGDGNWISNGAIPVGTQVKLDVRLDNQGDTFWHEYTKGVLVDPTEDDVIFFDQRMSPDDFWFDYNSIIWASEGDKSQKQDPLEFVVNELPSDGKIQLKFKVAYKWEGETGSYEHAYATDFAEIPVYMPLAVDFSSAPLDGTAPMTVTFANLSQGANAFSWNFGDGSSDVTDQNPIHIYTEPGIYSVSLRAWHSDRPDEAQTVTKTNYIIVEPSPANLNISTTASPWPSVVAGENLTYTIDYSNTGGQAANDAAIHSALAANTTFVSATNGGTLSGNTVSWVIGDVAAGTSGSIQVVVNVALGLENGSSILSPECVIESSSNLPKHSSPYASQVSSQTVLTISNTASPDPVQNGSNLTYTLNYANTGTQDATGVVIEEAIPANTSFVSATDGGTNDSGTLTWNIGSLPAGASGSVQFVVYVDPMAGDGIVISSSNGSILSNQSGETVGTSVTSTVSGLPYLSGISLLYGSTGTPVTLTGANFGAVQGSSAVRFSDTGIISEVDAWSDNSITFSVPGEMGSGCFSVSTSKEQSNCIQFSVVDIVTDLDSLAVPEGSTAEIYVKLSARPPENITVSISKLSGDPDMDIQSDTNLSYSPDNWNSYQPVIIAAVEDQDDIEGFAIFQMTAPNLRANNFTASEVDNELRPVVETIVPRMASVGDVVRIIGATFEADQGAGSVVFPGDAASEILSWSQNEIICKVPNGTQAGCLTVTTARGDSNCLAFSKYEAIYYVSNDGSDTAGDGSEEFPWETIQYAVDQADENTLVRVLPGEYKGPIYVLKDNIDIDGSGAWSTKIIGSNGLTINGTDVRVSNFHFDTSGYALFAIHAWNPIIANNLFTGLNNWVIENQNSRHVNVVNNVFSFDSDSVPNLAIFSVLSGNDQNIVKNNVFMGGYGIFNHWPSTTAYQCDFNYWEDVTEIESGPGDVIEPPAFLSQQSQLFLYASNSSAVDSGDPNIAFNDVDGTRNDLGLHGGPYAKKIFQDISAKSGFNLDDHPSNGGISFADLDSNGYPDIFIGNYTWSVESNRLLRNDGPAGFVDITPVDMQSANGQCAGATFADVNNDGLLDLYLIGLATYGAQFINEGAHTFNRLPDINPAGSAGAAFSDIENDGDLDLIVANAVGFSGYANIFCNNGDGSYTDCTQDRGVQIDGVLKGVIAFDYDIDGDQDLLFSSFYGQTNVLYENDGSGFFTDVTQGAGLLQNGEMRALAVADFNGDGLPDVFSADPEPKIFLNTGNGTFSAPSGLPGWPAGHGAEKVTVGDFDLDGTQDLYLDDDATPQNILYLNRGHSVFVDVTDLLGVRHLNNDTSELGNGDIDGDGDLDLISLRSLPTGSSKVYRNGLFGKLFIKIIPQSSISNTIGSVVEVYEAGHYGEADFRRHRQEIISGSINGSSPNLEALLGVNENLSYDVGVLFPDGLSEIRYNVAPGTRIAIYQEDFVISASAGNNGSVTPSGDTTVNWGESRSYEIVPDTGYHVVDVLVDTISQGPISEYLFEDVFENHTIEAFFGIDTYNIEVSPVSNGQVIPQDGLQINHGDNAAFSIVPDTGYHIEDVLVDGVSVGALSSYQFSNVTANHNITVSFKINSYAVTVMPTAYGQISPSGTVSIDHGGSETFDISPILGHHIDDVLVDGVSVGAVSSYQLSNVTVNHTIEASFSIDLFSIDATAGLNGIISDAGTVDVAYGSDQTYTITPSLGFHVGDVLVDGQSVGPVRKFTFWNVHGPHTISASFISDTYSVWSSTSVGGSITPAGLTSANHGENIEFTIIPLQGYYLAEIFIDGEQSVVTENYTFNDITADHMIEAYFELYQIYTSDTDYDNDVDGLDLYQVSYEYGRTDCTEQIPCYADFNSDQVVNDAEVDILIGEFGQTEDTDNDGILDDGDGSSYIGDNPCVGGVIVDCDDNCPLTFNPTQSDSDSDGIGDACES